MGLSDSAGGGGAAVRGGGGGARTPAKVVGLTTSIGSDLNTGGGAIDVDLPGGGCRMGLG